MTWIRRSSRPPTEGPRAPGTSCESALLTVLSVHGLQNSTPPWGLGWRSLPSHGLGTAAGGGFRLDAPRPLRAYAGAGDRGSGGGEGGGHAPPRRLESRAFGQSQSG